MNFTKDLNKLAKSGRYFCVSCGKQMKDYSNHHCISCRRKGY